MTVDSRPRSVYELIGREWGVPVTWAEAPMVTELGTSDVVIFANNPRRVALLVVNLSPNIVYIRPQRAATPTVAIRLNPNGGSFGAVWRDDMGLPALEWHGVASVEGSAVYTLEVVIR